MTLRFITARALRFRRAVLLAALFLLAGGCASMDSDLPWARQEPWEGNPTVPGMPQE
jgi:hypothetical protein